MGRWSYSNRKKDTDCHKLSIFWLREQGYLRGFMRGIVSWTWGFSGHKSSIGVSCDTWTERPHIELEYTIQKGRPGEENVKYPVQLEKTPCPFGGVRYWFICPGIVNGMTCNRRCAVLYSGPKYYLCRTCNRLLYQSQFESRTERYNPAFRFLKYEFEIERRLQKIKRTTYQGRLTRKMRVIEKLRRRMPRGKSMEDDLYEF